MFRVTWTDPNGGEWDLGWTIEPADWSVGLTGDSVDELVECTGPNGETELPAEWDQLAGEWSNDQLADWDWEP